MNTLEKIFQNSGTVSDYVSGYFTHLKEIIDRVDRAVVSQVIELMFKARDEGKNIFLSVTVEALQLRHILQMT